MENPIFYGEKQWKSDFLHKTLELFTMVVYNSVRNAEKGEERDGKVYKCT